MGAPEGKIETYLVDRVRATGGFVRKLKWLDRNGAPDRIVWWPSAKTIIHFVELKAPRKKPKPQQLEEHRKMRESGLPVFVLDTKEHVDDFIRLWT